MSAIKPGRVCVKISGRDAGEKVVVTKIVDGNFVMIKSPLRKKERRCCIKHLEPTDVVVSS